MKIITDIPKLPPRRAESHKGDYGRVLVLGGSTGMAGAAALTGMAALRAGAGLVTVGSPRSVYPIIASKLTCATTRPFPETDAGTFSTAGLAEIVAFAEGFDVVALGPGLGRHTDTTDFVCALTASLNRPMVMDADALNALAEDPLFLKQASAPRILTPHAGEMGRLAGLTIKEVQKARRQVSAWFASHYRAIMVLKGNDTVVCDGTRTYLNTTGNPGMATGGAGDVLTGVIAGLIAQRLDPFAAAVLGVYVHGLAGDMAAQKFGQVSLIATDLLEFLPQAFLDSAKSV